MSIQQCNLWGRALDGLDSDTKANLADIINDPRVDVLTDILELAEKKKQLCLKKRWKVEIRGKTIILRDLLEKIIAWANRFKAIIDVAVQYDQTSASLPWAGVRFLLQVAVGDRDCFEFTVYGLEHVSLLITRYAAFEALYLQGSSVVESELEHGIIDLHTRILTFLAHGIQYFGHSSPIRVAKSLFQSSQGDEIDQLNNLDEELRKLAQLVGSQAQQHTSVQVNNIRDIVDILHKPIHRLVDESSIYAKSMEEGRFIKILQWLSSVPYIEHQKRHSEDRLPNSCEWIFRHPEYITWKGSSSSLILLLHGIPGSGKTHVVAAVVDAFLAEHSLSTLSAPIAYIYCGDSQFGRKWADPDELMRSLTRQLAVVDNGKLKIHESIALDYARREAEGKLDGSEIPTLRCAECVDLILGILGANPAVVIVDGVDGIEGRRRDEFIESITRIRDESASVVKILLTSRDNRNILAALSDDLEIRVQEINTRQDMELYVKHCVSTTIANRNLLNGCVPDDLQQQLIEFLLNNASEKFLWVNLKLECLCKLKSARSVLDAIQDRFQASADTDYLYSNILENIKQTGPIAYEIASSTFSWLLSMQELLSSDVIVDAVSTGFPGTYRMGLSELLNSCSNLIVLDGQLDTLRFAHASFKEFLETKPEFQSHASHSIAVASCLYTCVNCLPIEFKGHVQPARNYDLYAVMYWARHFASSSLAYHDSGMQKLKDFVFGDDGLAFELWLDGAHELSKALPNTHPLKMELGAVASDTQTPLFTACAYGLKAIFHETVKATVVDVNALNLAGHTGLYLAAACGQHEIVSLILNLGGDPGLSGGKHGNALSAAAANGHVSVVRLLIDPKILPAVSTFIQPALRASSSMGHEEIAKLLLNTYLNTLEGSRATQISWILEAAAQVGYVKAVDELTKGSSGSILVEQMSIIVKAAIRKNQTSVVRRYTQEASFPPDAVAIAALFGRTEIIAICLDKGCDVEKECHLGTPLRCASLMGHEPAVRMLLAHGADVNASTVLGDALQAAAMKGHLAITNILIENGARLDNGRGAFGNALQAAAYRGHRDVAEVLMNASVSPMSFTSSWYGKRPGRYNDAFHAASEAGQVECIELFLSKGYTLRHGTLFTSFRDRFARLQRDLLRQGSPDRKRSVRDFPEKAIQEPGKEVDELVPAALVVEFENILQEMGDQDASEPNELPAVYEPGEILDCTARIPIKKWWYALEAAAARGHSETVARIADKSNQLGLEPFHIGRALWAASEYGHTRVAEVLMSADTGLGSFIQGSLERAARYGHLETIEALLRYEELWRFPSKPPVEGAGVDVDLVESTPCNLPCLPEDTTYLKYALPLVSSGCQGGQLSSVVRGLQLAAASEAGDLRKKALEEAVKVDSTPIVEYLLENDLQLQPEFLAQLMTIAATNGAMFSMILLLARDEGRNALAGAYDTCFRCAITYGHKNILQCLIDEGTENCKPGTLKTAFVHAATTGDFPLLEFLASKVRNFRSYMTTLTQALNAACAQGQRDTAEWLIHAGADVSARVSSIPSFDRPFEGCGPNGRWPRNAIQACLEIVLELGHQRKMFFGTVGDLGKICPRQEAVVCLLLENGADVSRARRNTKTPLHIAAEYFSEPTVRALIAHGADVNSYSREDGTPLQCAVKREIASESMVRVLLGTGLVTSLQEGERIYGSVLDEALKHFEVRNGPEMYGLGSLKSVEQVLSDGPGAAIKFLLMSQPQLHATDKRFGLLLQMLAVVGDINYIRLLIERRVDVNTCGHYYGCALQAAARYGKLECVQLLLDAGAEVDLAGGAYHTPLQAAIKSGHEGAVQELISRGADMNPCLEDTKSPNGFSPLPVVPYPFSPRRFSPLHLAVHAGNRNITRLLLDAGASPLQEPPVLHLAVEGDDFETTSMLLDAGADVNSYNSNQASALAIACGRGNIDIITLLLDRGAVIKANEKKGEHPSHSVNRSNPSLPIDRSKAGVLYAACANGHYEVVQFLLQRGADPAQDGTSSQVLAAATSNGNMQIVQLLLESIGKAYDPLPVLYAAARGETPRETIKFFVGQFEGSPDLAPACEGVLKEVFERGDEDLLLFLVKRTLQSLHGFALACRFGSLKAVKMMLSHGIGVDSDLGIGGRALHIAAYHQQADTVSFLIERGADVQFPSSRYGSPVSAVLEGLLGITENHSSPLCELLPGEQWPRKRLYFPHVRTLGRTQRFPFPDELAVCERILEVLLQAGAEADVAPSALGTPLHVAAYLGEVSTVKLLLDHGADINATGGYFGSALIAAMAGDRRSVFHWLLTNGIDANIGSERFGTALHYACEFNDSRTIHALLEHGADVNSTWGERGSLLAAMLTQIADLNLVTLQDATNAADMLQVLLRCGNGLRVTAADVAQAERIPARPFRPSKEAVLSLLREYHDDFLVREKVVETRPEERMSPNLGATPRRSARLGSARRGIKVRKDS